MLQFTCKTLMLRLWRGLVLNVYGKRPPLSKLRLFEAVCFHYGQYQWINFYYCVFERESQQQPLNQRLQLSQPRPWRLHGPLQLERYEVLLQFDGVDDDVDDGGGDDGDDAFLLYIFKMHAKSNINLYINLIYLLVSMVLYLLYNIKGFGSIVIQKILLLYFIVS